MISEETTADSSFESISRTEAVSRRELEIRLHLKELANVQLRRRLVRLEEMHDLDLLGDTPTVQSQRDKLLAELDTLVGRDNE